MRSAVLDLGTNTFNLIIADLSKGSADETILFSDRIPVMIGKDGFRENKLTEEAQERGINGIRKLLEKVEEYDCVYVKAFGTAAFRSADNGDAFIQRVEENSGLQIEIIDGDREAELIYKGVRGSLDIGNEPALILDIGGGSSEFIIANDKEVLWKKSVDIGAARLLERFHAKDPIPPEKVDEAREFLKQELEPVRKIVLEYAPTTLIGCSGSFESFSEMAEKRFPDAPKTKGTKAVPLNLQHFRELQRIILTSSLEERLQIPGLIEMRATMIVMGGIMIELVLEEFNLEEIKTSFYALREGALFEAMEGNPPDGKKEE